MSVVLAYADEHMAVVASDGRVSDIFGNIISEEYPKVSWMKMAATELQKKNHYIL